MWGMIIKNTIPHLVILRDNTYNMDTIHSIYSSNDDCNFRNMDNNSCLHRNNGRSIHILHHKTLVHMKINTIK